MIRVVRVLLGVVAILVALPLLTAGVTLWAVLQHRSDDGWFTASLAPVPAPGHALVVPDVDALLRREAPFVRGGQTTMRFTARTGAGPAFVGLAPRAAVQRYLSGVQYDTVTRIRLARGGLPVSVSPSSGSLVPSPPADQSFWIVSSGSGTLFFSPSDLHGEQLSLVVMSPTGGAPEEVQATAAMLPRWLDPTTYGLLILGTVAVLIGMVLLFWPRRYREIVYVVEPSQVPEIAARLGISTEPLAAALGGTQDPFDVLGSEEPADPGPAGADPGPAGSSGDESPVPEPAALPAEPTVLAAESLPAESLPAGSAELPVEPAGVPAQLGAFAAGSVADGPGVVMVPPAWLVESDGVGAPDVPISPAVAGWAAPTPVPAGQPGIYRSCAAAPVTPPPITPSFVWPPIPD